MSSSTFSGRTCAPTTTSRRSGRSSRRRKSPRLERLSSAQGEETLRISILCVGRLGSAPEALLAADWVRRAGQVGRGHGLHPVEIVEVEAKKGGKAAEGEALLRRLGEASLIACDEHGQALSSRAFAGQLAKLRDGGVRHLAFAIGGADGLDTVVLERAERTIAFGPQTWPHALVRAMLAEQVYRAASLMAGQPYHRD